MPAAPVASYAKVVKRTSFSHHRLSRTSGLPCTMGLTAYPALSPAAHCDHRRCNERLAARRPGWATLPSCNFNISPGRQDSRGFAVRLLHRPSRAPVNNRFLQTSTGDEPLRLHPKTRPMLSASIVIRPASRDDRDPPLVRPELASYTLDAIPRQA